MSGFCSAVLCCDAATSDLNPPNEKSRRSSSKKYRDNQHDEGSDNETADSSYGSTSTNPEDYTIFNPETQRYSRRGKNGEEELADSEIFTPLYQVIEDKDWNGTLVYLSTGRLNDDYHFLGSGTMVSAPANPSIEARRWVVKQDWWGNTVWRRLPLHAAILRRAPSAVIQKLIDVNPSSVKGQDHEGNLAVHLAFMTGASDNIIAFLLNSYPEAVSVRNKEEKLPVQYSQSSAGEIIQLCVDQTNEASKKEEAKLYSALESEKGRLSDILKQLSEIREELDDIKGVNEKSEYFKGLKNDGADATKSSKKKGNWRKRKSDIEKGTEPESREDRKNTTTEDDTRDDAVLPTVPMDTAIQKEKDIAESKHSTSNENTNTKDKISIKDVSSSSKQKNTKRDIRSSLKQEKNSSKKDKSSRKSKRTSKKDGNAPVDLDVEKIKSDLFDKSTLDAGDGKNKAKEHSTKNVSKNSSNKKFGLFNKKK